MGGLERAALVAAPVLLASLAVGLSGLNVGLLHHLHSGASFGPVGVAIGTLAGFAMVFFAFSGLWLYVQMWRHRAGRSLSPRWFWH